MISKLRSLLSQLCGIFPYICLQFTLGSVQAFITVLVAELHKKDSEIPMTLDQLSWFASQNLFKILGSPMTGALVHLWGSRLAALIVASLFAGPYLLYNFSTSATAVLFSGIMIALPVVNSLSPPHTSEIAEPRHRGSFLVMNQLANASGIFFTLLLGSLVYWRTIALVNMTFPIMAAITVPFTPISPSWLASRGRLDEAEKALCWLRGWVPATQVADEFRTLAESVQQEKKSKDDAAVGRRERARRFIRRFAERSFYLPLATIGLIFLAREMSGGVVIDGYSTVIFRKMGTPFDETVATAISGAAQIAGNVIVLLCVDRVGKRRLACLGAALAGLSYGLISLVGFQRSDGVCSWIPPIAMIAGLFANSWGIGPIALMLNSEIFPVSTRYLGASIGMSISMTLSSSWRKAFLYVIDAITLRGVFVYFALANALAGVMYYFFFPETDGKSLTEIEDHYKGVKPSNDK